MALSRDVLYGPERLANYSAVKDFNMKDNVLRKGDYNMTEANWETHYDSMLKDSLQKYEASAKQKNLVSKHERHEPKHLIGQDASRHFALTSRDYGEHRSLRSPAKANIDKEVHIVDFSPKYRTVPMVNSSVNKTFYKAHNNLSDSYRDRLETSQRTKDVRLTHFDLGNCKERLSTETKHSYNDTPCYGSKEFDEKALEKENNKNLHRSNIFQSGDWNATNRSLAKCTVTAEQFGMKKFADEYERKAHEWSSKSKSVDDDPDYKRTHIDFGKNKGLVTSFYKKDFMIDKRKYTTKPEIAGAPPSSEVIQRSDSPNKTKSINRSDYVFSKDQSYDKVGKDDYARNKTRHAKNNFSISHLDEDLISKNLTTITKSVYHQPPTDALTLCHERAPITKYRYLDTNGALLKPSNSSYQSEVKTKFGVSKPDGENCLAPRDLQKKKQDNSSHFSFGTDAEGRTTEQSSQFSRPMKLDPKTTAAGVKDLGTSAFAKIYDKEDKKSLGIAKNRYSNGETTLSVMQRDFQPLVDRGFTSPQQRLIQTLAKYPPRIKSSHFFHMANSEGPLSSRTKLDFIRPDRGHYATL